MVKVQKQPKRKPQQQAKQGFQQKSEATIIEKPKKFGWRDIFPILALMVSTISLAVSIRSYENSAKVQKLNIEPYLMVFSSFCKELKCLSTIRIKNSGLVDAVETKMRVSTK